LDVERAKRYATLPDFNVREPKTWKPFQTALRGVRPVIDRIREIGLTPAAKKLASDVADVFSATLKDETLLNGQFLEKLQLIHSEVKMSPAELDDLGDFQGESFVLDDIGAEDPGRSRELLFSQGEMITKSLQFRSTLLAPQGV
jgi:hypothetical protein